MLVQSASARVDEVLQQLLTLTKLEIERAKAFALPSVVLNTLLDRPLVYPCIEGAMPPFL